MKKQRPVNLDLSTISLPPSARASILHRVTGVAMFVALVFVMWAWAASLASAESFEMVKGVMSGFIGKFIAIGTLSALSYHIIGGIRHLIMDMGHLEDLDSGNLSANISIGLWILVTLIIGVLVW